jgi:large subunit ribosomal protein L22
MANRKQNSANKLKEVRKNTYYAKLNNIPSSPRKMRLVADMVRGMEAFKALGVLKFSNKEAAAKVEAKNGRKAENGELKVSSIVVDEGATIKRLRPAPQGRAYRVRKRSNHVTLAVDTINKESK